MVRRYDTVSIKDLVHARAMNPPLLQGLLIWYHRRPPLRPQIISLTDRPLREDEYVLITHEVGIPQLLAFFPPIPKRVGQTWAIQRAAVQVVSGKLPEEEGFELTGTLLQVGKAKDGKSLIAEIGIEGEFNVDAGPSSFNARIYFDFEPRGVALPAGSPEGAPKIIEAAGRIIQAKLAHATAISLPSNEGRLKQRVTYKLLLERRPLAPVAGEAGAGSRPITLPDNPPTATPANSWVTYDDPAGRFHFRHPEELSLDQSRAADPLAVPLWDIRPSGTAAMVLILPTSRGDAEHDRAFRDPASFQKVMESHFEAVKDSVTWGAAGWLDDEDLKPLNRKVYRVEAALKGGKVQRPYFADLYLVVGQNGVRNFVVQSWTEREDHVAFRTQIEQVIRSFHWAPAEKRAPGTSGAPADAGAGPGGAAAPAGGQPAAGPGAPPTRPGAPQSRPRTTEPTPGSPPVAPSTAPGSPPR